MKTILTIIMLMLLFDVSANNDTSSTVDIYQQKRKPLFFKTGGRIRLQFGGQIGANLNYFKYKNGIQRDEAAGYQGGLFLRVSRQMAFVQIEVNMLRSMVFLKNGVFNREIGNNIPFEQLRLKYYTVGIPFIFGAYAVKNPLYKLRFYNGIEAAFITKIKATIEQNNNEIYRLSKKEKRRIFRPEQFSYQLGMGMDIAMFIFDIKYSVGMRSFFKENYRTQTHLFQFTIGAIF
ncbi:MAG TPA: hypothetical protein PKX89_03155 [Chitinophagales bacterium]|nr:hypothetical protein [Chitinophagales bacterium]